MKLIAAVDKNWGLGRDNRLLFTLPLDMKRFKELTTGNTVVMGRKTLDSLPGGLPLKNRVNIVLGSQKREGVIFAGDLAELFAQIKNSDGEVFLMGGASVYNTLLPYCDEALITKVEADANADAFLTNLDLSADFTPVFVSEPVIDAGLVTRYVTYKNNAVRRF